MGKGYGGWLKLNRERKKEKERKKESNTCMIFLISNCNFIRRQRKAPLVHTEYTHA
jgi:translation initiation factor IF-2